MDALIGLGWPLSFGSSSLVFARFGVCPFLGVENLVLSLQDSRGVADALGAPLTYRLQGQNPLDIERVQLVGVRHGLEQLVQASRQPLGIARASISSMHSAFSSWLNISLPPSLNGRVAQHPSRSVRRAAPPPAIPCAYRPRAAREGRLVSDRSVEARERVIVLVATSPTSVLEHVAIKRFELIGAEHARCHVLVALDDRALLHHHEVDGRSRA